MNALYDIFAFLCSDMTTSSRQEFSSEWRFYIQTRAKLGVAPKEIHGELEAAWPGSCPSYEMVKTWCRRFKEDSTATCSSLPRSGRPLSVTTDENVTLISQMIEEDSRLTVREIADSMDMSLDRVHNILTNILQKRYVCAKWVPHLLTAENKQQRMEKAQVILDMFGDRGTVPTNRVITGDESWFYKYQCHSKQQNMSWLSPGEPRPHVARPDPHQPRQMFAAFFKSDGPLCLVPLAPGATVTAEWYTEQCLSKVIQTLQEKRPRMGSARMFLLHDNAAAHRAKKLEISSATPGCRSLSTRHTAPIFHQLTSSCFPGSKEISLDNVSTRGRTSTMLSGTR